jgi:hypothetical protein
VLALPTSSPPAPKTSRPTNPSFFTNLAAHPPPATLFSGTDLSRLLHRHRARSSPTSPGPLCPLGKLGLRPQELTDHRPAPRLFTSRKTPTQPTAQMAEQQTPTFKLVLVGDGGTGKVRKYPVPSLSSAHSCSQTTIGALSPFDGAPPFAAARASSSQSIRHGKTRPLLTMLRDLDHLRQAPLDW